MKILSFHTLKKKHLARRRGLIKKLNTVLLTNVVNEK